MSERIGPRWLTWIILAYGLLEIPWVIYLIFFQQRTGTAQHTHLAALGLYGGGAVMALWAAWASWRQHRIVSVAAVMAATWLTAGSSLPSSSARCTSYGRVCWERSSQP